jgi:hypothetical protein
MIGIGSSALAFAVGAAEKIDVSRLPPALTRPIDFRSEIKPLFEASCLRCHGAEKPKGGFSLSTREAALRGGNEGVAIVSGNSAASPLIHYVARLAPDMEMPPDGKGDPLTVEQVGLLRAWIDQEARWDEAASYSTHYSVTPAVRWVTVSGNVGKFQEHHWIRRGVSSGVEHFHVAENNTNGVTVSAHGRAFTDDYRVALEIRKPQVGFARLGFEQYRRYYDHRGPYYPFRGQGFATQTPDLFSLDRNLFLDVGEAFAEFGLTRPDWPEVIVGYEFRFKDGTKSTQEWGPVSQRSLGIVSTRHIFPAYKEIHEEAHVVRLDVAHDLGGVRLEDNLRFDFYDGETARGAATSFPSGQLYPAGLTETRENHDQFQFANTLRGEKAVRDWLFVSAGHLYSRFDAGSDFSQSTVDGAGRLAAGTFWAGHDIVLEEDAHIVNLNGLAGPWSDFTVSAGILAELAEQRGFGLINNREGDPDDPLNPVEDEFGLASSRLDRMRTEENLLLRYAAHPAASLFAEGKLKQERSARSEEFTGHHEFLRDSDAAVDWQEYEGGFDVSPSRWASVRMSYARRLRAANYDHERDEQPVGDVGTGYPAFITSRDSDTDAFQARLAVRPTSWLKGNLTYRLSQSDFEVGTDPVFVTLNPANPPVLQTPGGNTLAGEHNVASYGANVTFTPWRRWQLSGMVAYQRSKTWTADYARPVVVPFNGDTYSVSASSSIMLSSRTDLTAAYTYSRARFAQSNFEDGLPLGLDYDSTSTLIGLGHRLNTNVVVTAQYGFFQYDEPTAYGFNDYRAHMIFGTIAMRWR